MCKLAPMTLIFHFQINFPHEWYILNKNKSGRRLNDFTTIFTGIPNYNQYCTFFAMKFSQMIAIVIFGLIHIILPCSMKVNTYIQNRFLHK